MNEEHKGSDSPEERERARRARAISKSAQQTNTAAQEPSEVSRSIPPRTMVASAQRRRGRWYIVLGVVAAIAVITASLGVYFLRLAPLPPIQDELTLDLRASGLDCPRAIAWAPDGCAWPCLPPSAPVTPSDCPRPLSPSSTLARGDFYVAQISAKNSPNAI